MNSVILQIASRYVKWLLIAFALIALFRGHNHPGGGFIGGLLVGLAFVFKSFAYSESSSNEKLKRQSVSFIVLGWIILLFSMLPGLLTVRGWMVGTWMSIGLPGSGVIKLGTPLLFDLGVFMSVIGVTILFLVSFTNKY